MRTILVLGSGLMAESVITYLLSNPKVTKTTYRIESISPATFLKMLRSWQKKKD
jgi:hypothetical protein